MSVKTQVMQEWDRSLFYTTAPPIADVESQVPAAKCEFCPPLAPIIVN